jgi:hypothetical protein
MKKTGLYFIVYILLLGSVIIQAQTLEVGKASPRTIISVVKRVDQDYYLLTKERTIEFTVTGPTMIRVYSRLLWHDDLAVKQTYKIIISESGIDKISSFETEKSNSAIGSKKESFGKWRSFYIDVPSGSVNYKLTLLEAKTDTVAVRFSFEKPMDYKKIAPVSPYNELQYVENEKTTNYYQITNTEPIKVRVEGPVMLKATTRLNYDVTLEGKQSFTVSASVQGKEWRNKTFRVAKSQSGQYKNIPDIIPSTPVDFFVNVPPGSYIIEFNIKETLAKSACMSLYSKPLGTYE